MKEKILKIVYKILGKFANIYVKRHKPFVIGITGSVGKTSCRMIIYQVLKQIITDNEINNHRQGDLQSQTMNYTSIDNLNSITDNKGNIGCDNQKIVRDTIPSSDNHLNSSSDKSLSIYTSPKNFNGEYGLSLSVLGIEDYSPNIFGLLKNLMKGLFIAFFGKKKYDVIVLEYGIDHPGEMDFLINIVKPNISVITGIDKVHSMFYQNLDELANEKLKLAYFTKEVVFLNCDDNYTRQAYDFVKVDKFLFRVSDKDISYFGGGNRLDEIKCDIRFSNYKLCLDEKDTDFIKTEADIYIRDKVVHIKTNLIGKENIGYIGVGLAIADILAYKNLIKHVKIDNVYDFNFELQPGRFSIFKGIGGSILIDSTYNAAPNSMRKVIENVLNIKNLIYPDYKLILVLGDMRELGEFSEKEHRKLAGFVSQVADKVYVIGENMKNYFLDELEKVGFSGEYKRFKNSKVLGNYLYKKLKNTEEKYIILFKGSQNTIFLEEALKQLLVNQEDIKKLPRQSDWWLKKKEKFFKN